MSRLLKISILVIAIFTILMPPKFLVTPVFATSVSVDASCAPWSGVFVSCGIASVANIVLTIATNFLGMAATTFDFSIDYSLNMAARLDEFKFVSNGWAVLRDVTNLAYIFILLYIAINIILGNSGYGDKSLIAKVLVTAVFVNFSLFGAKVIVDATNIAALQFYNLIIPASTSTNSSDKSANAKSLTSQFMNLFNLQSIYSNTGNGSTGVSRNEVLVSVDKSANKGGGDAGQSETWWNIAKLCAIGTVFVLAVTVVFFAGAFLFISRTVVIFFLMLFAAMAVASRALPSTKGKFDEWLKMLINNAIFAPIFLGLIYILISATNTINGKNQANLADMILNGQKISGLVTFFMYLAFLVGILAIAKALGIQGGAAIHGFADKYMSPMSILRGGKNATIGGAKMAGKGLLRGGGNLATAIAEDDLTRRTLGRVPILGGALANVGKWTGAQARRDAKQKEYEARDKYLSSVSPQGPNESDDDYKKRKDAGKARGKSAAGFKADGTKKTGLGVNIMNMGRWITGGGAWTNFQNDKAKKYKKDAKTKDKLDVDLLTHARTLGNLLHGNPGRFITGTPPNEKVIDADIDTRSGLFTGTLLNPNGTPVATNLFYPGSEIATAHNELVAAEAAYQAQVTATTPNTTGIDAAKDTRNKKQATFDKLETKLKSQFDGYKTKFQQREALED